MPERCGPNPKRIVARGYDVVGDRYATQVDASRDASRRRYESALLERLPTEARVLDLGCGNGQPTTKRLAERAAVVGVDISRRQIERARRNVPNATFILADIGELALTPGSVGGVAAFFSLIHLPREELAQVYRSIAEWLRPGGAFVGSFLTRDREATELEDWLGAPMFWSSYDAQTNRSLIEQCGLKIVSSAEERYEADGVPGTFLWVVAERASDAAMLKRAVAEGYDRVGGRYAELATRVMTRQRRKYTDTLLERVPRGARVLDLGCGAGLPTTRELAQVYEVTGLDISARQVARARSNVPGATFARSDMAEAEFAPESFDAVAAFYSIIHLPRDEQPAMLRAIASWLRPGGLFVGTLGARSVEAAYEELWLGTPMYWSSHDSDANRRLVGDAGLEIISAREETTRVEGDSETFLWVVARKPCRHPTGL